MLKKEEENKAPALCYVPEHVIYIKLKMPPDASGVLFSTGSP